MNKRFALFFLLYLIAFGNAISSETLLIDDSLSISIPTEVPTIEAETLPLWVPFVEVMVQNTGVWLWDLYVLKKNYARISPSIWKRNLKAGWTWDDNHFAINFFGHPYQGVHYHGAARSSGLGFYPSFFYDMTGSFVWEFFCEREYPSLNDFITTSFAGALYGEILYRLSERLLAKPEPKWYDHAGAFVLQPSTYLQRQVVGVRPNNPGYFPIDFSIYGGAGLRFGSDYRYDKTPASRLDEDWNEFFGFGGFNLTYGSPSRIMRNPLEYFTISTSLELGQKERLFNMELLTKLKNINKLSGNDWFDLATYASYDVFYGDLVEMSSLSLGIGTDFKVWLRPSISFRLKSIPSLVLLGSTDFNYDDILKEVYPDYEPTRTYQLNYGINYKTAFEIRSKYGFISNNVNVFVLKTMPSSEPHYGATGWDVVGFNSSDMEVFLLKNLNLGLNLKLYFKIAAYHGKYFEPMSRTMETFGVYMRYLF